MTKINKDKPLSIGQVALRLGIHEQTIRTYERRGLLKPSRSEKNTRHFSERDVIRIMIIIVLTQQLGLNLSGVKLLFDFARFNERSDEELLEYIEEYEPNLPIKT